MTRNSVAANVARHKEAHPEKFCPEPRCLWRIDRNPCAWHDQRRCPSCGAATALERWDAFAGTCAGCAAAIEELPA